MQRDVTQKEFDEFWEDVAKKIKKARTSTKPVLTIEELADKAKIGRTMLYYLENGERRPSIETLFRIAAATGGKLKIEIV